MSDECGYEGQVLDRQVQTAWLTLSVHHPLVKENASRLGDELSAAGIRWKIGMRSPVSMLVMVYSERVTTRSLRRQFTLFKTWLSPETRVADDREWMEGPVRQAFARAGLADAAINYTGEIPHFA